MNGPEYTLPDIHFVGGIHGVGKSTFATKLGDELKLDVLSAGQLIRDHDKIVSNSDKRVLDVASNQNKVLSGLLRLKPTSPIVLDGHFCLINGQAAVTQIPFQTFEQLSLRSILLLVANSETIRSQLAGRDAVSYSSEFLEHFQSEEIAWAKVIAEKLAIPFASFTQSQLDDAATFIHQSSAHTA